MKDDRSPLDPATVALLRGKGPTASERSRVRARLAAAVPGMGGPGGGGSADGGPGAGGLPSAGGLGTPIVALAVFVMGAGVGAALVAALSRPPPPAIVYLDRPVLQTAAAGVTSASTTPNAPSATLAATVTLASTATPAETPRAVAPARAGSLAGGAPPPSSLAAERAVLDEARVALAQGQPERSLERLERHRRDFPRALLGEERDAMWVEALARVGRSDQARARAEAFERRWPGSLFLPTVRSAVASIP